MDSQVSWVYNANNLSETLFSFYLERYVNEANQISAAPGGVLTLGGTNSSLYNGSIPRPKWSAIVLVTHC